MITLQNSSALMACFALAGCGSSSPALEIANSANIAFIEDDGVLSVTGSDIDVSLPLDPIYDRGTFVGAKQFGEDFTTGQILAVSETSDSFAVQLIDRQEDGPITSQQFYGRTTAFDDLPTGRATLTGSYVGTFNESDPGLYAYIDGDVTLDVSFDEMTISGTVENMMLDIFGFGPEIPFQYSLYIDLLETPIAQNGSFSGVSEYVEIETGERFDNGSYRGLLTGGDSIEAVGSIAGQGVFAAGH